MTAVEHDLPVIWVIFNDGEFQLPSSSISLSRPYTRSEEPGRVQGELPDFAAYARAQYGANGYHSVEQ